MDGDPGDPLDLLRPRRHITGISAVFLPWSGGDVDWPSFTAHLRRTVDCGLVPAVNMDTGFVHLLDDSTRAGVLSRTKAEMGGQQFVAGAYVADTPRDPFGADAYKKEILAIQDAGAVPVVFPSHGLSSCDGQAVVEAHAALAAGCDRFIAFELSPAFSPAGRVHDLDTFQGLMEIPACVGAKHSSLSRELEWQRLRLRDRLRPDFKVFTGNDLAIDMVCYGSDYLLGLSTFAPDLFARRDAMWEAGDLGFWELNDGLQFLGDFSFRRPVPAYKDSAARFLHLRGWVGADACHPKSERRPESDVDVLRDIGVRLGVL